MDEVNLFQAYEQRRHEAAKRKTFLPVTILTGCLGAGKTTLMSRILQNRKNLRIGAIVNDFGEVNHDGRVLDKGKEKPVGGAKKLSGGCFCCEASLHSSFKGQVWSMLEIPDYKDEKPDYLIVETSGVSDPSTIINALNERFGKMTRARLDSVVVVVDADMIFLPNIMDSNLKSANEKSDLLNFDMGFQGSTWKQLQQADVIIINKIDLISNEKKELFTERIAKMIPRAAVHCCSYGNVPIHYVLDIVRPDFGGGSVSHELITAQLYPSQSGGNLRKNIHGAAEMLTSDLNSVKMHLEEDNLMQVTYLSNRPMRLADFQDWIISGLSEGIIRIKGMLSFTETPEKCVVFNLSGRRRCSIEDIGLWAGPVRPYLVLIGQNLNSAEILQNLTNFESQIIPSNVSLHSLEELNAVRSIVLSPLSKGNFEFFEENNAALFRFFGQEMYNLTPLQLRVRHGVDLDAVNMEILKAVNSAGGCILTYARVIINSIECSDINDCEKHEVIALRWALSGRTPFLKVWQTVLEHTKFVVGRDLSYITSCNCRA